jgi:tRNA (guanosine-2'-O-)-methyltransferase
MTPQRFQRLRQALDRRQPDLTVLTEHVSKPHNLAAIVRTCDAVGILTAHAVLGPGGYRPRPGTSLGSERWVKVERHNDIETPIAGLRTHGFQIVAAHFSTQARDFREIDYTRPTAILMGAEKTGVCEATAALADAHVTIPMMGMVASFNVSVAAAIILAEAQYQRQVAGLYAQPRLDPDLHRTILFRWSHPAVARFCDQRGLPYPALSDSGDLLDVTGWRSGSGIGACPPDPRR